jgi:hypothetical protein
MTGEYGKHFPLVDYFPCGDGALVPVFGYWSFSHRPLESITHVKGITSVMTTQMLLLFRDWLKRQGV